MGSHLVQRNKPIPSASEAGICPERLPLFAEIANLASVMQTDSAIGDQRRAVVFRPGCGPSRSAFCVKVQ
jgi:hypothetical protein